MDYDLENTSIVNCSHSCKLISESCKGFWIDIASSLQLTIHEKVVLHTSWPEVQ